MRRTIALAATAAALLTITACGTDTKPEPQAGGDPAVEQTTDPQAEAEAALKESVRSYTKALFGNDPDAGYDLMSARCQDAMPKTQFAVMAEQAHHDYGAQEATNVKVNELAGNLARVSYGAGNIPQFDREGQAWTREDGTWKWDACPAGEPNP